MMPLVAKGIRTLNIRHLLRLPPARASLQGVSAALIMAGALLQRTSFGWPLIIGGALKAIYDVLLLVQFRSVPTLEAGVR